MSEFLVQENYVPTKWRYWDSNLHLQITSSALYQLGHHATHVVGFQCINCTQGAVVRRETQGLCPIQVNDDKLEFASKFCYLEDMIGSGVALKRHLG